MTPAPPRWIGPRGLVTATVGALACAGSVTFAESETALAGAGISLVIFGAAAIAAWVITAGPSATGVPYKRALVAGVGCGAPAGVLALAIHLLSGPRPIHVTEILGAGGIIGVVAGLVVTIVSLPLTVAARDWKSGRPLDAFDRALGVDATVLALVALPCTAIAASEGDRGLDGAVGSVLAACGLAWFALRAWRRRRWLERVGAGGVPGFAFDDASEADALLPACVRPGTKVLTHTSDAVALGPFRAGEAPVVRLARIDPERARRKLGVLSCAAALLTMILLAAQPSLFLERARTTNHTAAREPRQPEPIAGLDGADVVEVAAGDAYACARLVDGGVRCWGNSAGSVLVGRYRPTRIPEARPGLSDVAAMSLGVDYMCIVHTLGVSPATCWGAGNAAAPREPAEIGPAGVVELASGGRYALAVTADGKVHRWGEDPRITYTYEQRPTAPAPPVVIEGLPAVAHVAAASEHACAIDRAGAVWCWGDDSHGAVTGGRGDKNAAPTRVEGLPGPAERLAVALATTWALVRGADGRAQWWAWGERYVWAPKDLERGPPGDLVPAQVPGTEHLREIVLARAHACALTDDGAVSCWSGASDFDANAATHVLPPGSARQLSGGESTLCARGKSRVWCWAWAGGWAE